MSRSLVIDAPAKINLTLEVIGRRPDGYHELASIFATVAVADRVRVAPSRRLDVRTSPPVGADDLAARAVLALAEATGRPAHAHVRVRKRIPVGAGLGGGSADAAAVLRGLASLWRLDRVDLTSIGAGVGSDVPFFLSGAAYAFVRGRGERIEALPAPTQQVWVALVPIARKLLTRDVFAALDRVAADGKRSFALAELFRNGAATPAAIRAHVHNDLVAPAQGIEPAIREAKECARSAGIDLALSGSGSTLFAVANDRAHALWIARRLRRAGLRARAQPLGVSFRATSDRGLSPYL
jgi:4-diphosphocytidyl-2-C-methyl-D-erythritol kinase